MKNIVIVALLAAGFLLIGPDVSGQVKIDLKKKITKETNKRANRKTDETINKGFNNLEKGLKGLVNKKESGEEGEQSAQEDEVAGNKEGDPGNTTRSQSEAEASEMAPALTWAKYDFVPGDKIIFEDNLLGEENGEFPSRWDLVGGTVENAVFGGDNVIMFRGGDPRIVPYLKNSNMDYLPEVFTIEFDLYLPYNSLTIYFFDRKNQKSPSGANYLSVWSQTMDLNPARSNLPDGKSIQNVWAHIAIAYTNGKMKAYIDDTRLINIPHLKFNPSGVTLGAYHANDNNPFYIKNFRIAEGGVKYYDRFLQDGKIVSNGIRFDVGKATLRPESMGVLNEIYKMLSEHPDVAVSVEGHTDSDGDNDLNLKLSEERAETVMKQLVSMGLTKERLSFRGYGESNPVSPNDTPEGKASNRRVEFVKKSGTGAQNSSASMISKPNGNHQASSNSKDYQTVTIGNQVWMQKNLDVDTFLNGDPIPQAKTEEEWQDMKWKKKAAWCYWNFISASESVLGKMYNYYAIIDPRGLAPEGWRIPGDEDWDNLRKELVVGVAGDKMKSKTGWKGANGTNSSGFDGKATGYCDYNGSFVSSGIEGYWWSSTDDGTQWSSSVYLSAEDKYLHKHHMAKGSGLSVRCLK